ncbi:hypothetical protein KCH_77010 [Kitasatospora cheerisanensis KCTC 2395]|uniref:Uncharacterized protein n=1 Tax=Kitasatospora cheerisanensis KCTC 2395 TaxID=1348663 RepID=A0A066YKU8_9ACTN|nr:hypothetical protein KCH_77010 [Kitasatospora cheerisanensis KCTC 2395]
MTCRLTPACAGRRGTGGRHRALGAADPRLRGEENHSTSTADVIDG